MRPRQRIAIDHPCKFAQQTIDQLYHRRRPVGGGRWIGTILTVNSGYE